MTAKPPRPPATIRIRKRDGTEVDVSRLAYIDAKWKQMREFGFVGVSKKEIRLALDLLLNRKPPNGATMMAISEDLVLTTEEPK